MYYLTLWRDGTLIRMVASPGHALDVDNGFFPLEWLNRKVPFFAKPHDVLYLSRAPPPQNADVFFGCELEH